MKIAITIPIIVFALISTGLAFQLLKDWLFEDFSIMPFFLSATLAYCLWMGVYIIFNIPVY
jgi:hypothetical protein